ncbi:hypothetical protein QBC37DRAFT_171724 [Rhypophila decipiens]|uniref:Uncharacterized protein n=1 Tax=Rhypophila decipiens TaxID=261697 RepID=A0AAN6Y791_9PEZI|nr:hypothetical protein QBC37DRAFT_171724 [Rhypophila decipiens]
MAPEKAQYTAVPPIPTYDEAIAGGSSWHHLQEDDRARSPIDDANRETREAQSLLNNNNNNQSNTSSSRPGGYRPPTVESEDDDDGWSSSDSDTDEAEHVRREMQELEIEDPNDRSQSSWGKRIGFSLNKWQWRWKKWRLPQMPSFRRRTTTSEDGPGGATATGNNESGNNNSSQDSPGRRFAFPTLGSTALFLLVGRLLALFLVLGFVYLLFVSDMFSGMARRMNSKNFEPESVRVFVQSNINPKEIRQNLAHFTKYAHIAGTEGDYFLAEDTERIFRGYGLEDVVMDEYKVYLNYPKPGGRAVELIGKDGKATWSAKLEEDRIPGEDSGRLTAAFHGHSKSGDVRGPLVYANYGSREDFQKLKDMGIGTRGAIALVKYYGSQGDRALKVKAAEMAGFAGCLIYSDPADDGLTRGDTAPKGRYMPADGVQRGSVSLTSWVVGDVLTPGWGSKDGVQQRVAVDESKGLVKIPSLPLSSRDAHALLMALQGHGQKVPDGWAGEVPGVKEWWTGNQSSPIVRLKNEQDENVKQPIWNVYGRINGIEQQEKKIIIGNHRDSWTLGATDPHSGTAVMLEVIRVFGELLRKGWRPLRTIEFMSWDAEEYNLIGSTEYVEQNDELLKKNAFAYINLDTAVTGDSFHAAGSPVFKQLLLQVLNRVGDPVHNTTLRDLFDRRHGELEGLGAGSDYVAFQDIVGTSSLDLHFDHDIVNTSSPLHFGDHAYPYHSSYDTFEWMENVGDPGFIYHTLLGQIVGLLILELADRPILPFDISGFADALPRWIDDLSKWAKDEGAAGKVSFAPLKEAAGEVTMAARRFHRWENKWENSIVASSGWEPVALGNTRADYNSRMGMFETNLLDEYGVPNRTQFKHVIFGPQLWSSYDEAYFPAIRDLIAAGEFDKAKETVHKVAGILKQAAFKLLDGGAA